MYIPREKRRVVKVVHTISAKSNAASPNFAISGKWFPNPERYIVLNYQRPVIHANSLEDMSNDIIYLHT